MKKGQGLVGVLLVLLVVFQDEGAPDEPAVGVEGSVLWPPNVDHHLVTECPMWVKEAKRGGGGAPTPAHCIVSGSIESLLSVLITSNL